MTYRRTAIPAVAGGLLLTALLWWAGASVHALELPGTTRVLDGQTVAELRSWLLPWAYDPLGAARFGSAMVGGDAVGTDGASYTALEATGQQIRFGAVLVFFSSGALFLLRRLPPERGRMPAALLALWAWGLAAGTLAVTVSAPWWIASGGRGSFRFLPHLAGVIASGREVLVGTALVVAVATVLVARLTVNGAGPLPREVVPTRAARLSATVGTAVVAVAVLVVSRLSVAAALQSVSPSVGVLSEPGDLLRQWLLFGAWSGPGNAAFGAWLLDRGADVLLLVVVWWALRRLPGLLTRATVPAMAMGGVCATVLGLLAGELLRMVRGAVELPGDPLRLLSGFAAGVPAALVWGLVAGVAAAVTLRVVRGRAEVAGAAPDGPEPTHP
ncbi:hypothetical protein [Streptomyces sp. WZ-12]|uniref:hypothetical protein n=1 Tax=Streptomyces sp. WZ-12 TaxID=3030210 RepID=UPI002380F7FA|nr:hypothetical protein [Streptomyces sp. WZ-12]